MAGIQSMGIGSGLDLNGLVSQLVAAERMPTDNRLNKQESILQAKLSAYGSLRGGLATIESPLKRLSEFESKMSVSNSNSSLFTVTATDDASPGNFTMEIDHLAAAQTLATNSLTGSAADGPDTEIVASGATADLTITVGGEAETVALDASGGALTLRNVRDLINESDAGVSAFIMTDDTGSRLVLTADETGENNTIAVTTGGTFANGAYATELAMDGTGANNVIGGNVTQIAQNASGAINGLAFESADNSVEGLIDGLSFNLLGTTDSPASFRVSEDTSSLRSLINEFVGGYNELIKQTKDLSAYDAEQGTGSLLTGDATVRGVERMLRDSLVEYGQAIQDNGPVTLSGNPDPISVNAGDDIALANLGLVSKANGALEFNSSKFNDAVQVYGMENIVAAVNEIAGKFHERVSGFTDSNDGVLDARTSGLKASIEDINQQREAHNERMISYEAQLTAQFNAMDSLVASMSTTQTAVNNLSNLIGQFNNNSSGNK